MFLKLSFDVFECEKNPWTYFLKILYVKNIYFEKYFGFWALFSAAAITGAGDIFFLLFSSHFDRLLLQLQTLQVSEVVLVQKYFLSRPWSEKNLMSSWGEGCVGAPLQHPLHVFCSLARAHPCCMVFTFHSILISTH